MTVILINCVQLHLAFLGAFPALLFSHSLYDVAAGRCHHPRVGRHSSMMRLL